MKINHFLGTTLLSVLLFTACNRQSATQQEPENKAVPTEMKPAAKTISVDPQTLAIQNDVVCGMPLTEGIADTLSHAGKKYGFCSSECKDAFSKSPDQYLSVK